MSEKQPTVSIGLAVYNGAKYLRQTLDALLAQDYRDFELLISDNASTDETAEIATACAADDGRIRYHRNDTNIGAVDNFNRVCDMAGGKYFMWASCHDLWDKRFLSLCTEAMEADESVVLCCPRSTWIDVEGNVRGRLGKPLDTRHMSPARRYIRMLRKHDPYHIYGLFRFDALKQVLPYRKTLGPDDLLLVETAFLGSMAYVDEELFYMRKLGDFGNWHSYFRKINLELTPWTGPLLCLRYLRDHLNIVSRRGGSGGARALLHVATVGCVLARSAVVFASIILEGFFPRLIARIRGRKS